MYPAYIEAMKTKFCFDGNKPAAQRPRWMIVDDNEDILWVLRHLAAQISGADITCFLSPCEALAAFTAAPESFELVVTDLEMPGMSGIELCERLHALLPAAKILLTTGSEIITDAEARDKGFCGLLHKPFAIETLQNTLEAVGVGTTSEHFSEATAAFMFTKGAFA